MASTKKSEEDGSCKKITLKLSSTDKGFTVAKLQNILSVEQCLLGGKHEHCNFPQKMINRLLG